MTTRPHRHDAARHATSRHDAAPLRQPAILRLDAWIALAAMACYIFILTW